MIPIYAGDNSHSYTEYLIQVVKDFKRSIDYLETRPDIDSKKIAYYGMSWGGMLGAIIPAEDNRQSLFEFGPTISRSVHFRPWVCE
ncbi:MAG: hypothetical protein ACE5HX_15165 [bacterium]